MPEPHRNDMRQGSPVSAPLTGHSHGNASFSMVHFDLSRLDDGRSPIMLLDDFRVSGRPFGPHPHAGFSAITYVFEDSPGALRSRDSLGNDLTVGAGGIVWLQSGRGALHEETPEEFGREIHGAQIYVNLHAANKALPPQTFWLQGSEVPSWRDEDGNVVRVVVGAYKEVSSPLLPAEAFNILDLHLQSSISVTLGSGSYSLIYARDAASVGVGAERLALRAGQVVAVYGDCEVSIRGQDGARLLLLSGASIHEPRHQEGPFILNHPAEMKDVILRYQRGEMGVSHQDRDVIQWIVLTRG